MTDRSFYKEEAVDSLFRTPGAYIGMLIGAVVPGVVTHDVAYLYGGFAFMGIVIVLRAMYVLEQIYKKLDSAG